MNWICTESDLTMSFCNFAFSASRFLTLGVLHEVAMRRIPIEAAIANKILFFFIMISVFFLRQFRISGYRKFKPAIFAGLLLIAYRANLNYFFQ